MKRICSNVGKILDERYGFDMRNKLALWCSLISVLVASAMSGGFAILLYTVSIISLVYVFWLMLSKDISRRTEEMERLEYVVYRMRRKAYIVSRCLMVWRRHGYFVHIKCGQHVCFLCREKKEAAAFMYASASAE